jgi:UDP-2-acetamido-3-amino-2,3-dideoxy-glucuronate N-acetyltransferase
MADFFVHESSYVDKDVTIGENTKIWHFSHIQSGAVLGKNISIGQNVNVGNNVHIGDGCKIQNNVSIYEGVELEDYVFCGPSMVFTNVLNPRSEFPQRGTDFYHKTLVKKSASIGANATIVCGHTVGQYSFVAAGAVVASDVPDFALVAGVPAKVLGWVCRHGHRLKFDENNLGRCEYEACETYEKLSEMKVVIRK